MFQSNLGKMQCFQHYTNLYWHTNTSKHISRLALKIIILNFSTLIAKLIRSCKFLATNHNAAASFPSYFPEAVSSSSSLSSCSFFWTRPCDDDSKSSSSVHLASFGSVATRLRPSDRAVECPSTIDIKSTRPRTPTTASPCANSGSQVAKYISDSRNPTHIA